MPRRVEPLLLAFAAVAWPATLAQKIDAFLATSPAARRSFWGVQVVDLRSGKVLYQKNQDHFFVPASNTKLFTTALALNRLGPDYTFQTRVVAAAAPDSNGRIKGDLRLVGGGDPNLSGRAIPYQVRAPAGDPLAAIEDFAAQVAARGVRRISGDIVGDDSWYPWEPYAAGWSVEDPQSDDGPPVSALTINDNVFTLHAVPGEHEGDLAVLTLDPAVEYYAIDNRLRTVPASGARRIHFDRIPGSMEARLTGSIPLDDRGADLALAVEDPARYAALALRRALEARGIMVEGNAVSRHTPAPDAPEVELARRVSAPLIEDLRITDKVSQNLHAELALRAVGRARRGTGTIAAGLEEMRAFLEEIGVPPGAYFFRDGSGLARLNLVTPGAIVKLLLHMYGSPMHDQWLSLLPVSGEDGSLRLRFTGTPAAGRVHAKTGSLSHVSALSGYIQRRNGSWVVFSILANNYNVPTAEVRGAIDRICTLIVEERSTK